MGVGNQEMATHVLAQIAESFGLKNERLGDVALGAIMQHPHDWNLAREAVLGSGLHPYTPAYNVQRACGAGLETIWQLALKIAAGQIESAIGGGTDTNSDVAGVLPRALSHKLLRARAAKGTMDRLKQFVSINPKDLIPEFPDVVEPRTHLSMGQHTEKMVQEWHIARVEQDKLAYDSHRTGSQAYAEGFYSDLVTPFHGVSRDGTLRDDTSLEKLARLPPAFDAPGERTLTAGNSSPLTDGAAAVLIGSEEYGAHRKWEPLAYFVDAEASAVDFVMGDGLLMAPTVAVARLLERNHLKLQDFDFYEIHEAFAGQVLCTLKAWESHAYCRKYLGKEEPLGSIDRSKMNLKGGSVALGHPFAATGGRIVASLAKQLHHRGSGRGLISICTAGGMGVAAILEK